MSQAFKISNLQTIPKCTTTLMQTNTNTELSLSVKCCNDKIIFGLNCPTDMSLCVQWARRATYLIVTQIKLPQLSTEVKRREIIQKVVTQTQMFQLWTCDELFIRFCNVRCLLSARTIMQSFDTRNLTPEVRPSANDRYLYRCTSKIHRKGQPLTGDLWVTCTSSNGTNAVPPM